MPRPLELSASRLEAIAAKFGTPYQLYDEGAIRANCRELLQRMRAHFPGFRQYFAVKALPNPAILRILVSEGCGLDCSSVSELHIARALGVAGADVMYTSNYTSAADLATAFDHGVVINLDDASLVASLVAVRGRVPELISFRLNPGLGRTDSETASNVLGGPDAKFGVPPDQIVGAYAAARAAGATRFGLHMMTGSCVLSPAYWADTVALMVDTVARVHAELGITFDFLNIGGGLGIPYRPGQAGVDVEEVAKIVAETLASKWASSGLPGSPPRLCMENGRYMTGPYGQLVARCEVVKSTFSSKYYGLDACMANLMRPGMYGAYHFITVPRREEGDLAGSVLRERANVVGTLCENNDWFAKDRDGLPATARVGDLFVIHDTGAHSHSMGFQYNGKLRAPELLVREAMEGAGGNVGVAAGGFVGLLDSRVVDLLREREGIPSLFANCVMPADLAPAVPAYPYAAGSKGGKGSTLTTQVLVAAAAIGVGAAVAVALVRRR